MASLGEWVGRYLPVGAVIALPAALLWALLVMRRRDRGLSLRRTVREAGADVLLALSLFAILALTVLPVPPSVGPASGGSLMPLEDLLRSLRPGMPAYALDLAVGNLVANLLLFVPFGLALGLRFPGGPRWRLVLVCLVLSASVEAIQLVSPIGRSADVTDILTNTLGGALGLVMARGLVTVVRSIRSPAR